MMSTGEIRFHELLKTAEHLGEHRISTVENRSDEHGDYAAVYLETELIPGQWVKTYFWIGVPYGETPFPAMLHIHGGGSQTANLEHVRHWTSKGYVALSYDWKEELSGQAHYSDLADMPTKDMEEEFDPLQSVMFTRLIHAKKMVTWLAGLPEVDAGRMGAFGISRGGTVTRLLNAWDNRLQAAAPIYGCGKHMSPGRLNRNVRRPHTLEDTYEWEKLLSGWRLAEREQSPMLIMSATNDYWGWMDAICEGAAHLPKAKRGLFFAANQNHHLDGWAGATLDCWMDALVKGDGHWPQAPAAAVSVHEGTLRVSAVFSADKLSALPQKLRFCWSWYDWSEVLPPGRCWHVKEIDCSPDSGFSVEIPVIDPAISGFVYVDAIYADGVKTSSFPLRFSPIYLGAVASAMPLTLELADFTSGLDGWHCPEQRTEPFDPDFRYVFVDDPEGGKALALDEPGMKFALVTHKPVDPMMQADKDHLQLQLRLYTDVPGVWEISVLHRPDQAGQIVWVSEVKGVLGWTDVRLARQSFDSAGGKGFSSWDKMHKISVCFVPEQVNASSGCRPALGSVRFV
ncbi:dienelactone hydrolase family protein [Paenibacillus anseongense]|uniref:dienelactone hydrolase family protein n=1 Tax=Paenibacillus anseongense TaxID=2682845 RepID=UPI002DBD6387|nr:acetylxylan esterase [Paenibacillus anseongense]MEC0269210.1 acetylxylan esterase [Paenibacillus anseongense]